MNVPYQPNPRVQPPQPQPQPKSKKWPWIVGGVVAIFVIAGVSGGGDDDESSTAKTSTTTQVSDSGSGAAASFVAEPAAPEPEKPPAGLNTPVRDGKFEFVVTDVQTGLSSLGDNPFLAKKAQGQFVVVTMSVENVSNAPKGLSPSDQKLTDAQGRTFKPDTSAALNLETDVAFWDEINPGNTVTMPVVFDMPADAVPTSIELHDSMFSGGVTVQLR